MSTSDDIKRLIARYKAAIVDFNNKNGSSLEICRQELEALRWEEQVPLVYRLRARALLTGDFVVGCWRGGEEEHEQQAFAEIGAGVEGSTMRGLGVEDLGVLADFGVAVAPDALAGRRSCDEGTCCATARREVVNGGMGPFAGFGSPAAEPTTEPRGETSLFGDFGNRAAEPMPEPTQAHSTERRQARLHVLR
jgi:hypothetical protein